MQHVEVQVLRDFLFDLLQVCRGLSAIDRKKYQNKEQKKIDFEHIEQQMTDARKQQTQNAQIGHKKQEQQTAQKAPVAEAAGDSQQKKDEGVDLKMQSGKDSDDNFEKY